ncbi:DUF4177 domain-containing protein [Halocynthiibacter namhaensis]|uniref:DUF4177 domain-containing protein n=1 Tax=Halocynthiibacter namhaensis TaxID=1290553 RepID=UPI000690133F|nr:DUF4177 domain-containing protein [Halocynthiibacter namhaensis]
MPAFEYKVVPAPLKGIKSKGARGTDARFAAALMEAMNEMGKDGWEYQRSETLPCESRSAMGKKSTQFLNMLVFRRETTVEDDKETQTTPEVELPATPVLRRVTTSAPVEEDVTTDVIEETQASDDDVPNEPKAKIAE